MKVILKKDVKKIGNAGDEVEVAEGYGRNYLIPHGLAVVANKANKTMADQKRGAKAHHKAQEADEAKLLAKQLETVELTIPVRIGEGGKLFGSVNGKSVSEALKKAHDLDIDKRKITIEPEVTGIGDYDATIKVHPEVMSKIKVHVVAAE